MTVLQAVFGTNLMPFKTPGNTAFCVRFWLILVLGLGLAACRQPASDQHSTRGGRLVVVIHREPTTLNRMLSAQAGENLIALLTQSTLVRVNRATGALEPRLAREWTASPDGLTTTFKLRDVTFSDGRPFTAADVVFT